MTIETTVFRPSLSSLVSVCLSACPILCACLRCVSVIPCGNENKKGCEYRWWCAWPKYKPTSLRDIGRVPEDKRDDRRDVIRRNAAVWGFSGSYAPTGVTTVVGSRLLDVSDYEPSPALLLGKALWNVTYNTARHVSLLRA
ncbi:hypothetical protein GGS21DRAFT_534757 [Xylaria nigripes]|nr:hypothetical protein GGS21DRAFT_534757 [Xylaria nigripes]